jgi:hypothetical protein
LLTAKQAFHGVVDKNQFEKSSVRYRASAIPDFFWLQRKAPFLLMTSFLAKFNDT